MVRQFTFCFSLLFIITTAFADAGVLSRSEMKHIQQNSQDFQQNEDANYSDEFAIYEHPHSYIEARGGYDLVTIANNTYYDNTPVVGGDVGYQFDRYTALEGGGLYFFDLQSKVNTLSNIQQWNGYGALKFIYPLMRRFHVFTKVGVQYTEYHTAATSTTAFVTHDDTEPYFAVGGDMLLNRWINFDVQYSFIPANNKNSTVLTPNQHLITGAIGLNF